MLRRQQIDETCAEAGRRFDRHLELAFRGRSVTPSYSQRMAEGTPASQLAQSAAEDAAARHVDYVAIHGSARAALPAQPRLAILLACEGKTLVQIGRMISRYKDDNRAVTAAVTSIGIGLDILTGHYRMRTKSG
jgi:hypothetical protein